ncbi:MAG: hypothetical protein JO257_24650 [Deltaproteobacteria bacterium]|nr:hypothetical protein [Deltaproteobacteria bacterium]
MQARISQGPYAALGIAEDATAEQVRASFLALTKQFHPARFGRLATDVQRLANEVFLGIKGAHDQLLKQLGGGKRSALQSGGMPVITDAKVSGMMPAMRPPTPSPARPPVNNAPAARISQPIARTTQPIARPAERPSTPAVSRTPTPIQPAGSQPETPVRPSRTTTPPLGTAVQRPTTTPIARPITPTGQRAPSPPQRPPTASSAITPDTVRGTGGTPSREPAFDERAALREALMQLNEQSWSAARQTLSNLASKIPQSKNYRALLGYARGREAQAAGRADEAALEFQRALELDPQLAMAKQALAEVQRRR